MTDPIKHVVVLLLENHSFDQMLGCLDGVDGVSHAHENRDDQGHAYRQESTRERQMLLDPHHELEHVAVQLENHNSGFVKDFVTAYPDSTRAARAFIMGYYPRGFLPALHKLAMDFTICDHWFASVPGPTWPNRFFALTGTSNGRVNMPNDGTHKADLAGYFQQSQDTVFDRLTEKGKHWKVYFHDIPQSWTLEHQRRPENAARYFYVDEFFDDCRGPESEFPEFCLIEPDFMGTGENDDHPPHDVMKAEKLIADVYNSLRANGALWESTLLVLFYDEHGGFYDHEEPPAAVAPDEHREEYTFDRLGVRVPALLISPWVDRTVERTQFDHTSLLKYLVEKWGLGPLGDRTARATSIGVAITRRTARHDDDMVRQIMIGTDLLTPPDPTLEEKAWRTISDHQKALQQLGHWLWLEIDEGLPPLFAVLARSVEAVKGALDALLKWARGEGGTLQVAIAEPDKIARKPVRTRDETAKFTMRRKLQSLPVLAGQIDDPALSPEIRQHAVHTLALIVGRPFHREPRKIEAASAWLAAARGQFPRLRAARSRRRR